MMDNALKDESVEVLKHSLNSSESRSKFAGHWWGNMANSSDEMPLNVDSFIPNAKFKSRSFT